jgi:1-deoxy-D-xylulose-5-phosphate reductoisomerase
MIELIDGAVLAQLGVPDMRLPISYALTYPDRVNLGDDIAKLDVTKLSNLTFEEPDLDTFPCLRIARDASKKGGTAPAVMNAANESAVDMFLKRQIKFSDIPYIIIDTLETSESNYISRPNLDQIIAADNWAREYVTVHTMGKVMDKRISDITERAK